MDDESTTVSERTPHAAAPSRVPAGVPSVVRFSDFEFDFEREQLRRGGRPIRLSPKPAALLRYLLANPQRLLGKAELMERLWGEVVVTDDSLVQCVGELRSRLGEQGPKRITTHPRRGYMLEAEVCPVAPGEPGPAASSAREVLLAAPVVPATPVSLLPPTGLATGACATRLAPYCACDRTRRGRPRRHCRLLSVAPAALLHRR